MAKKKYSPRAEYADAGPSEFDQGSGSSPAPGPGANYQEPQSLGSVNDQDGYQSGRSRNDNSNRGGRNNRPQGNNNRNDDSRRVGNRGGGAYRPNRGNSSGGYNSNRQDDQRGNYNRNNDSRSQGNQDNQQGYSNNQPYNNNQNNQQRQQNPGNQNYDNQQGNQQGYGNQNQNQGYGNNNDRQQRGGRGGQQRNSGQRNYGNRSGGGQGNFSRGQSDRSDGYSNGGGQQQRGYGNQNRGPQQQFRNQNQNQNRGNDRQFAPEQDDTDVELQEGSGMLEMHPNGYGFLRSSENNYARVRTDPFVPGTMIERYGLRAGLVISGMVRPGHGQTGPRLKEITDIEGLAPEDYVDIKTFDSLTPINPSEWYNLEIGAKPLTNRVVDLLVPMGKGQRALIVAPPRSGKTMLLQDIAKGISKNHPDATLIVLLIDERPEEVTDMRRNVNGEVVASSLDEDVESHVRLSQMVIERCKRLAEMGKDVFLLMDSITRLARAFNKWVGDSGRTMSGGVDIKAMDIPKKLFATARAFEEGGSVTIAGTALIDTDSRMDELIFQEFKGTGNLELVLDRKLAERRIWPALDIGKSGTRREDLLLDEATLDAVTMLRRTLTQMNPTEAMEQLTKQLTRFDSNTEFIKLISGKMLAD